MISANLLCLKAYPRGFAGPQADWEHMLEDNDRRAHRRRRVLKTGKIIFNDQKSIIDCVVRDETDSGA